MKTIIIKSKRYGEKECLLDDEDFDVVNKWRWKLLISYNSMYAVRNATYTISRGKYIQKVILMHRLILNLNDKNILVDHKDQNGLNNQKDNLRTCTKAENNRNIKSHRDSTSKYLGVCRDSARRKWKAGITFKKKLINIGRFESEEAAALAYNEKAKELFKEFASLNIITL